MNFVKDYENCGRMEILGKNTHRHAYMAYGRYDYKKSILDLILVMGMCVEFFDSLDI